MLQRGADLKQPMKETMVMKGLNNVLPTMSTLRDLSCLMHSGVMLGMPCLSIREMGESIRSSDCNDAAECFRMFQERLHWNPRKVGFHNPLHSAAMLLHTPNWEIDFAVKYGHEEYGNIREDSVSILEKVSPRTNFAIKALMQYDVDYKAQTLGYFQSKSVQSFAKQEAVDPTHWWLANGFKVPELQHIAC